MQLTAAAATSGHMYVLPSDAGKETGQPDQGTFLGLSRNARLAQGAILALTAIGVGVMIHFSIPALLIIIPAAMMILTIGLIEIFGDKSSLLKAIERNPHGAITAGLGLVSLFGAAAISVAEGGAGIPRHRSRQGESFIGKPY